MPSCHWQLGLCPLHKASIEVLWLWPREYGKRELHQFPSPALQNQADFTSCLGKTAQKVPSHHGRGQTTFFERPHREALRPYGEVECPNDPSFQDIPSKVAGHVSKAYWTLQIRLTHRRKPTHRSLLVGGAIPVNCAWILDPQVMNK